MQFECRYYSSNPVWMPCDPIIRFESEAAFALVGVLAFYCTIRVAVAVVSLVYRVRGK